MITQAQIQQFHEEGYFLTDVVFDATAMSALKAEFDRLWACLLYTSPSPRDS